MKIYGVYDPEFARFGRILEGDHSRILKLLEGTPLPESGTIYCPSDPKLEEEAILAHFKDDVYGGMPVQIGYCNGFNQKLNCLEYHKGNEVNMANEDFILILGSYFDIENMRFDTKNAMAFKVPAKVAVEIYSTTLHYAPCGINGSSFKVLVVLPKGTNVESKRNEKDRTLWATNKWLFAHKESKEASEGAYIGLLGENLEV